MNAREPWTTSQEQRTGLAPAAVIKVYLAGPLFTEGERAWCRQIKRAVEGLSGALGREISVIWPWELIDQEELATLGESAKQVVFAKCLGGIHEATFMVAILDGALVDDGTSFEVGYFYGLVGKDPARIIGIRTDLRQAGESRDSVVNAMIECACSRIVTSIPELLEAIQGTIGDFPADSIASTLPD